MRGKMVFGVLLLPTAVALGQQPDTGRPQPDPSKPVPPKSAVIRAWQTRQHAIDSFSFSWTEEQTYPKGWLSNPRYPERERLSVPALLTDRTYVVSKTLEVSADRMRYGFEFDRPEEPDGIRVVASQGSNNGFGVRRHYSYLSTFDGRVGATRITTFLDSPPPTVHQSPANIDAQNLDVRPILMAFRPLDPNMGHLLIDRAVTNERRRFYRGNSVFLLEEQHDPTGWKTMLWVEPERAFLVRRYAVLFEQKLIADVDIDYLQDSRWGWIPSGWRITEMLSDGTKRLVTVAKVAKWSINNPIPPEHFRP